MISKQFLAVALAALARQVSAAGVTGSAEGFAEGVTGGGSATAVYPTTTAELVSYLGDSSARVIILQQTFDFTGTEGTATETGCAPWGTGSSCQTAINQNSWCDNYESSAPDVTVSYDKAGVLGITVGSNKSIVGSGSSGVIKGKGLRLIGSSNVIIQNIKITDLNPEYVWGGDAITLDGTDLVMLMLQEVWIDHVSTSLIGRQHIVLGTDASNRVTISNCDIDGTTSWSPNCDTYHYWNVLFLGSQDLVTFKNNYLHHFSGRAPKVGGNTLLHAVNNYFYQTDSSGHAFEIDSGGMVLAEGNVFQNVVTVVTDDVEGQAFTSPSSTANTVCETYLGRDCVLNAFGSSGTFNIVDTDFLANFEGKNIASATSADTAKSVASSAGFGNL
ncbi:putative Pectin lyase B [Seiridium cardinale]|uniref:pectin lyase n=1 Tax=Seiridium cardinale TaxID=138064 RepID=A0ABR2Y7Q7_9PEZI